MSAPPLPAQLLAACLHSYLGCRVAPGPRRWQLPRSRLYVYTASSTQHDPGHRRYYQRFKVCKKHSCQAEVVVDGVPSRFCQQCCTFQNLSEFDGDRR